MKTLKKAPDAADFGVGATVAKCRDDALHTQQFTCLLRAGAGEFADAMQHSEPAILNNGYTIIVGIFTADAATQSIGLDEMR